MLECIYYYVCALFVQCESAAMLESPHRKSCWDTGVANIRPDAVIACVLYNLRDMQSYFNPVKEQTNTKHLPDTRPSSCARYRLRGRLDQISMRESREKREFLP